VNASNRLELTLQGLPMSLSAEIREPLPAYPAEPGALLESNPQSFILQLADVCASVQERRDPFVTGKEAAAAVRWIERCYARRKPITL
jgi:hypothetical protein